MVHVRDLDLPLLLVLEALISERSVTRAARRMGRGQPAMSHALMRLRRLLGDPVLVRTSQGMTPTPRAVTLYDQVRPAISALRRALAEPPAFDPATAKRTFTVITRDYTEVVLLPALLGELQREAPGIQLRFLTLGDTLPVAEMEAGRIDLAIGYFAQVPEALRRQQLLHEAFVCLVRADHPAAAGRMTLARYCALRHLLISPEGGGRGFVDAILERHGQSRTVVLAIPDFVTAPLLVSKTDLIVTLPARIAAAFIPALPLATLAPPFPLAGFPVTQVWSPHVDADAGHRWLRRTIAHLLRAAGSETPEPRHSPRKKAPSRAASAKRLS